MSLIVLMPTVDVSTLNAVKCEREREIPCLFLQGIFVNVQNADYKSYFSFFIFFAFFVKIDLFFRF